MPPLTRLAAAALCATALAVPLAPALAQDGVEAVEATMIGNDGEPIGTVMFTGNDRWTVVRLAIMEGKVAPGWHGIHFHQVPDCSDPATFEASKGHVAHGTEIHGMLNPKGPHDGDLPNVHATETGAIDAEVSAPIGLAGLQASGAALVMHADPDDHTSQPIGGAGKRIGCAVLK